MEDRGTTHRGHFIICIQGGSVLYVCTKFDADSSISSKVITGSQNFEIGSRDQSHTHLGVVLWSTVRVRPPSLYGFLWSGFLNSFKSY